MVESKREPNRIFYPGWIVLSALSIPIAFAIALGIISRAIVAIVGGTIQVEGQTHITEDFLGLYILVPVIGLLTGFLQYLLLCPYLPRIGWWIGATFLGWSLTLVPLRFLYGALSPWLDPNSRLAVALAGAVLGVCIALPQWLLLRRRINRAAWWILSSAIGWGVASLSTDGAISSEQEVLSVVLLPPIVASIAWWLLLDKLPHRESNGGKRHSKIERLETNAH